MTLHCTALQCCCSCHSSPSPTHSLTLPPHPAPHTCHPRPRDTPAHSRGLSSAAGRCTTHRPEGPAILSDCSVRLPFPGPRRTPYRRPLPLLLLLLVLLLPCNALSTPRRHHLTSPHLTSLHLTSLAPRRLLLLSCVCPSSIPHHLHPLQLHVRGDQSTHVSPPQTHTSNTNNAAR